MTLEPQEDHATQPPSPSTSPDAVQPASPSETRPPLPPRPSELALLSAGHGTSPVAHPKNRGSLLSRATTAVSMTDVNTYTRSDGQRETSSSMTMRVSSSPSTHHFSSNKTSDGGDETSSIRSFVPNTQMSQDIASLFGDGLDGQTAGTYIFAERERHQIEREGDIDFEREFADISGDDQDQRAIQTVG